MLLESKAGLQFWHSFWECIFAVILESESTTILVKDGVKKRDLRIRQGLLFEERTA